MAKISSYIKALTIAPQKAIRRLSHWENWEMYSPKRQNDLSGLIAPRLTGGTTYTQQVDLQYLQTMYDCHDLVYNCISLVSTQFALGRLRVKQRQSNGKYKYLPDHPLQKMLDAPNSSMTGYDLRQSYIVHRLLFGTVALILIRGEMISDDDERNRCPACHEDQDVECWHVLWAFHKGKVTQIIPVYLDVLDSRTFEDTPFGRKTYFYYNPNPNGPKMPIHPDNIITDPNYNPGISFHGSSPTAKVQRWLEIDLGLSKQVGAYFANNAIPSMILNIKPAADGQEYDKDPSEYLKMMKEKWMEEFSFNGNGGAGSATSGRGVKAPAFIYGEIDVKQIQDSLKDIVVKELFYEIQNRIAQAYKVPRAIFEFGMDYSSQGSVVEHQYKAFFNEAIAPELETFKAKMERYILPSYEDPTLELEWDLTKMGIAAFLLSAIEAQWLKRWELGTITLDELREALNMNPYHNAEEGNDRYRISVMSDSSGNTQANQNKPSPKIDNRLENDPDVDAQATGIPRKK